MALILGVITSFVKPVLTILSIPFIIVTLGLFLLVINALMLMLAGWLAEELDIGFRVDGFWPAVGGAIIITITTWIVDGLIGTEARAVVTPDLPARAHARPLLRRLVCLGNICRSPMADVVLQQHLADAGLGDRVTVASSGTGDWHIGHPMDRRAAATLTSRRLRPDPAPRPAVRALVARGARPGAGDGRPEPARRGRGSRSSPAGSVLYRDFDPVEPGGEVPDPYYGGDSGFEEVLDMVERTSVALVAALAAGRRGRPL